jgi:proteasome lid subunit RPN8/RPN11
MRAGGVQYPFKIRIDRSALATIFDHVGAPFERIGLLMGWFDGDALWITSAIRGDSQWNGDPKYYSALSPEFLAKVADAILSGRIPGRIVGWYHSHVGQGVFMSDIDLQTHLRLAQFSPYVVSMVIDSKTFEYAIFSLSPNGSLVEVRPESIEIV